MAETGLRIFLSSRLGSLHQERLSVRNVIEQLCRDGLGNYEVIGSENFPAHSDSNRSACVKEVKQADLLVGIIARQFSQPVEDEIIAALEAQKPTLLFRIEDGYDERWENLLTQVGKGWTTGHWIQSISNSALLGHAVYRALSNLLTCLAKAYLARIRERYKRLKDGPYLYVDDYIPPRFIERKPPQITTRERISPQNEVWKGEAEKPKLLSPDDLVKCQRVYLWGPSGCGKSTSCRWLIHRFADTMYNASAQSEALDPEPHLPILVYSQGLYSQRDLFEELVLAIRRIFPGLPERHVRQYMDSYRSTVFFDGLEDRPGIDRAIGRIRDLAEDFPKASFVVTGPAVSYSGLDSYASVMVDDLTENDVRGLLDKKRVSATAVLALSQLARKNGFSWLRRRIHVDLAGDYLLECPDFDPNAISSIPLLAQQVFNNRLSSVFAGQYIQEVRWKPERARAILSCIAGFLLGTDASEIAEDEAARLIAPLHLDFQAPTVREVYLRNLVRLGFLSEREDRYSFAHNFVMQFFAGLHLIDLPMREVTRRAGTLRWFNALGHFAALASSEQAEQVFRHLLRKYTLSRWISRLLPLREINLHSVNLAWPLMYIAARARNIDPKLLERLLAALPLRNHWGISEIPNDLLEFDSPEYEARMFSFYDLVGQLKTPSVSAYLTEALLSTNAKPDNFLYPAIGFTHLTGDALRTLLTNIPEVIHQEITPQSILGYCILRTPSHQIIPALQQYIRNVSKNRAEIVLKTISYGVHSSLLTGTYSIAHESWFDKAAWLELLNTYLGCVEIIRPVVTLLREFNEQIRVLPESSENMLCDLIEQGDDNLRVQLIWYLVYGRLDRSLALLRDYRRSPSEALRSRCLDVLLYRVGSREFSWHVAQEVSTLANEYPHLAAAYESLKTVLLDHSEEVSPEEIDEFAWLVAGLNPVFTIGFQKMMVRGIASFSTAFATRVLEIVYRTDSSPSLSSEALLFLFDREGLTLEALIPYALYSEHTELQDRATWILAYNDVPLELLRQHLNRLLELSTSEYRYMAIAAIHALEKVDRTVAANCWERRWNRKKP